MLQAVGQLCGVQGWCHTAKGNKRQTIIPSPPKMLHPAPKAGSEKSLPLAVQPQTRSNSCCCCSPRRACSEEDSGELAALAALQRRRRSVAPGSTQKRYGSWFEGDDRDLEHTLHEYNRAVPASPRLTRAQRRKSLAVDRSLALEPGLAKAALEDAAAAGQEQLQQLQQQKRAAGARRKSVAATQQVRHRGRGASCTPCQPAVRQVCCPCAALAARLLPAGALPKLV